MHKRKNCDDPTPKNDAKKPKKHGAWNQGLLGSIGDSEYFVKEDDLVTVIKDKYPKAKYHYLVLPKENISSIKNVTNKHSDLLKHMENVALDLVKSVENKANFNIGYHAEPSMMRLHLHVISDDFDSVCLKNKKHWNSFTTDFFLKSEDVRRNLKKNGTVLLPTKDICRKYVETPLKCHKCEIKPKNMPELKKHITQHLK